MHVREKDICRFTSEVNSLAHGPSNIVFIDEAAFDNRSMKRLRGYGLSGEALRVVGEFRRSERVSVLCFVGVGGLLEAYHTQGTFTRKKFANYCMKFLESGHASIYRGPGSIWIMDGTKIHCDAQLIYMLRKRGVRPLFCRRIAHFTIQSSCFSGRHVFALISHSRVRGLY